MISHHLARLRPRLSALVGVPRSIVAARLSAVTSCAHRDSRHLGFGWRCSLRPLPSSCHYSPTPRLASNQVRLYGSSSDRDAPERGSRGRGELQYTRIGGPIDRSVCDLSETEIHNLINARNRCRQARDFQRADRIKDDLQRYGVHIDDKLREWSADGKTPFERMRMSPPNRRADGNSSLQRSSSRDDRNRMPRMKDCHTMDQAILAIHDNLDKASHRDIAAFWAVVPRLLGRGQRTRQPLVPQLTSIFNKTAERIGNYGPQELATTALGFAKIVFALGDLEKINRRGGAYQQCLQGILADKRDVIFQFIATTAVPILSQVKPRELANLTYAYGLVRFVPRMDDGSTLFHHIADKSIPQLGKFKPQELSNTVWAFATAEVSHPGLFEKMARHIVALERLHDFKPQALANTLNAFAKVEVTHPQLFEKIGDHIVALDRLDVFKPQELSNTLNAFAKAGVTHPALFEKMADHIVGLEHLHDFKPQELINTVNAFAKAGVSHPALFATVADHIVGLDLHEFKPQALANIVNAFAKAGLSHPRLFEKVGDHIVGLGHLNEYNAQDLSNTVNAFAKAGVSHPALFAKVADHIVGIDHLHDFEPQELSNTVHAFAKAGVSHPALFERIADHIVGLDHLHAFKPQSLSNTAWAFAKAKVPHPALFDKVANHIISLKDTVDLDAQSIANLAWAYQTAGVKNGRLADYLLISAVEKKDEFSERTIKNFLRWTEEDGDDDDDDGDGDGDGNNGCKRDA